jgi:CO/xanthine dehydrogenase Mo-binding subunit
LSFYFHGAGFTGSGEAHLKGKASVATTRGGGFEVRSSSTDIGQGSNTMFSQIAATALGVDIERVSLSEATTEVVPNSGPTVASRTCMVVGRVVEEASAKLRARLEKYAEQQGLGDCDLCDVARSHYAAEGEAAEMVTYDPPPGIEWDDETYTGSAYPCYGWAACLVDVAVDLDTYEVTVERCVHAVDVGKAIHPVIVKGQIEGGTLQALGWALWENVVYRDGRVVNASMTDCIIPTFWDAPDLDTILVEEPYPYGPHGAKGVGEIPMDGPGAAVAAALEDALGVAFDELPILPETIHRAVRGEGGS